MEVYKREGSPYWQVDFVHPKTGRRVRRSTGVPTSKKERVALEAAYKLVEEATRLDTHGGKPTITVEAAIGRYVSSLEASGKASAPGLRLLARKTLGDVRFKGRWALPEGLKLHDLTPAILADLVAARQKEGNRPQTIAHELKLLRAASRHAKELRFAAPDIDNWRLPKTKPKLRYLSLEEWKRLYAYMDPNRPVAGIRASGKPFSYVPEGTQRVKRQDAQDLMVALTMTGGRWSEVAKLTWEQVDTQGWQTIRLWGSKTDEERLVGIAGPVKDMLVRRLGDREPKGLIFPGLNGEQRAGSSRAIRRALEAVGLNKPEIVEKYGRATIHSLRHTYASWAIQGGAGLADVQGALGHKSLHMTRRYAHLDKRGSALKMAKLLTEVVG